MSPIYFAEANQILSVVTRRRGHRIPTAFRIDVNHRIDLNNRHQGHQYVDHPADNYHHRGYGRHHYGGGDRSPSTESDYGSSSQSLYSERDLYHDDYRTRRRRR